MKITKLLVAGAFTASAAFGQILYVQDFNSLDDGALDGQAGFSVASGNATYTVTEGGLSYTNGPVVHTGTGNHLALVGHSNENPASVGFTEQTSDVYFSFLFQATGSATFLWMAFSDDADFNSSGAAIAGFDGSNRAVFGRLRDGGGNNTNSTTAGGWDFNDTYLVVGRLSKSDPNGNYDSLSVLLDPDSLSEPATWGATVTGDIGIDSLDTLVFRVGGSSNYRYNIDMLRVGESFDAVVIPEPRLYAPLAGLLALALVLRRRRC